MLKNVTDAEWAQILDQCPSNDDLRYLISCTTKKEEAAEQLLKQNPSKNDLICLIEYTTKKDEATKRLHRQDPSKYDPFAKGDEAPKLLNRLLNQPLKMIDIIRDR